MANKFPNLLIKIASIFTSCFNTKQSSDCQGIMVPYTGHPVLRIKRASLEHSTRSLSVPRAKTIIVLSNLPRMNAWQLLNGNKYNLNVSQEQILASMPKGTVINRIIEGRDGVRGVLTKKSSKHLTTHHGYEVGIDDIMPINKNSKPTKYPRNKTKTSNPANELYFASIIEKIMKSPDTQVYPEVMIRGTKGYAYFTTKNYGPENPNYMGFVIAIASEKENAGRIIKAQSVSPVQLIQLRIENKIQ